MSTDEWEPCDLPPGGLRMIQECGPVSHAVFRLSRLHNLVAAQILRETGLYRGQEVLMMHLWETGPQRQVDLLKATDTDAATMTRSIRRLEQAGFVTTERSTEDRRAVIVAPTEASCALRDRVTQVWRDLEHATVADLDDAEVATALRALRTLERNLLRRCESDCDL
ncbi:Transcriptional regulator, MarR family [Alloactinosynnema sp. L-07]|uniref:MarR family winged helix-turn-helix transcriptional regulator n=1 Tax=Alloactinosynnema sp. L-07 TaxID=1653480 RepID=UPI00065F05F0|nr:MarR family winged helix-turn-helix transcriptional regulator [Alloactinosynnema sp. L-07]CRK57930.1 Transcriptional regulator, MarR family [Alloactinosynnema sp. L-07]